MIKEQGFSLEGVVAEENGRPEGTVLAQNNALCFFCHDAGKYDTPKHHHHKMDDAGASCIDCHMPEQTYMVVDPRIRL